MDSDSFSSSLTESQLKNFRNQTQKRRSNI